jgi:prepilin-type N-terminal cleavage/methylation domain-containing protein
MKKISAGFTLVEIIVVVSIVAILSAIIYANFSQGSAQSRDAKRKSDLRNLQTAIELYKTENGRYPAGCNGVNIWSGHSGSYACAADSQYIVDLAPKYIKTLPVDPKLNGVESGYMYLTNEKGTVYKLVAWKTVETEVFSDYGFEFQACDIIKESDDASLFVNAPCPSSHGVIPAEGPRCSLGTCNRYYDGVGYQQPASKCRTVDVTDLNYHGFRHSYAVWGGYANPSDVGGPVGNELKIEQGTEQVICEMPS